MNVGEIVKDSLRYPFSDWRKLLILGILFVIADMVYVTRFEGSIVLTTSLSMKVFFCVIAFIFVSLIRGYFLRIINSSLNGINDPPKFNKWMDMLIDGVKLVIVGTVYLIPVILIIVFLAVSVYTLQPLTAINSLATGFIWFLIGGSGIYAIQALVGTWFYIILIYIAIIGPIIAIAYAHMANNENKLILAFDFKKILKILKTKGFDNIISWYISTVILLFIIGLIIALVVSLVTIIFHSLVGSVPTNLIKELLFSFFLGSYEYMYLSRSIALFYKSDKESLYVSKIVKKKN